MGWSFDTGLLPHNDLWRRHRKIVQQGLRKEVMDKYNVTIDTKTGEALQQLAASPDKFLQHIEV